MPPPLNHPSLNLQVLPETWFVVQLPPQETVPAPILEALSKDTGKGLSVTRTPEELSIAGAWREGFPDAFKGECTWRCIKIAGPMSFSLVGVLAQVTAPLQAAQCPVFVTSTWSASSPSAIACTESVLFRNTDYILVPKDKLNLAVDALKTDGWCFSYSLV
ncbi:hypothetical protein VNI00_002062 [Paramarasmius palmivorus]|uniref:CASTOR ACT domain-containing protein n=1 Tax=Paramarasmius palmivorus TaxID=297713 RepID=A0AAW0E670_9AGAR